MACAGLHCACCSGGSAAPALAFGAAYGLAWVAEHIIEVAIVSGACGVLSVAAVVALMRWCARRDARRAAFWAARVVTPNPQALADSGTSAVTQSGTCMPIPGTSAEQLALGFRELHIHLDGIPAAEQAAVIRQALNRNQAGGD